MQIDFSQGFMFDGAKIQKPDGKGPVTLASATVEALLLPSQDSGEDKAKAYHLAMRVSKGGVQEVTVEEIAAIKKKIGEQWPPIIVGPAFDMLEGKTTGKRK